MSALGLTTGVVYNTRVRALSESGLYSAPAVSDGFMLDTTPPLPGELLVLSHARSTTALAGSGVAAFTDAALTRDEVVRAAALARTSAVQPFQGARLPIHLLFSGYRDPESAIYAYE